MPGRFLARIWPHNPHLDAPPKYRRACSYATFIPERLADLEVGVGGTLAGVVAEADAAIRALNQVAHPALAPLARLLLRTESIASSRIEGMQLGVRELARAEARMETGRKAGPTAREVLANIDAMDLAVTGAASTRRVTPATINAIHRRLMRGALNAAHIAGRVRTTQNWIGGNDYTPCGADFVPPPPEHVARLLADLCVAINDDLLPPIVQAALVHAQFETIHPYADGNGRTGRALIHVVLRRRGVAVAYVPPISVVLARGRNRYIAGLSAFRGDDIAKWIEQFASAAYAAARVASTYLERVRVLGEAWKARLTRRAVPRSDATVWTVLNVLPAWPIITAPVAAAATGRSKPQVYAALQQLERARVLVPLGTSTRNRSWEAVGLLDVLEELEAGE